MSGKVKSTIWLVAIVLVCAAAGAAAYMLTGRPRIEQLTILLSGNTLAYVANCGCAGGQSGGELRQARVIRQEYASATEKKQGQHAPHAAIVLETGNFTDPATPETKIQSEAVVEGMRSLNYNVVGLGSKELAYPQQELLKLLGGTAPLPLTCCNLKFVAPPASFSEDKSTELNALLKPYRVLKLAGGYRVGVINAIQTGNVADLGKFYGFVLTRPAETVGPLLDAHYTEADYWILTVSDADDAGSQPAGLEKLNKLDVIFGFGSGNPLQDDSGKVTRPRILPAPYHKAKDLMRIRQYFKPDGTPAAMIDEALALRADVKYDDELDKSWQRRQLELEQLAADVANQMRDARATAKPPFYLGQNACMECHSQIYTQLIGSQHVHAYTTLVDKGVEKNASCVKCHVVGYGTPWGWNVKEDQLALEGVQCENCHGPASYHVDLYKKKTRPADFEAEGRDKLGLLPVNKETCLKCHTPDNSPQFNFDTYWPKIKH